jgi:hypothetical protein
MLAGGGSDTEVSGRIITSDGKGLSNTVVLLIPSDFTAAFGDKIDPQLKDTTNSNGEYSIKVFALGTYNLEAVNISSGKRLFRSGINISSNDKAIKMPDDSCTNPSKIHLTLPDSLVPFSGAVYISGSTFFITKAAGNNYVILDSVPKGLIPQIKFAQNKTDNGAVIYSNIQVSSDSTIYLNPFYTWRHSAKIRINTTQTGIYTINIIKDFSLLLRLTSRKTDSLYFDFSTADIQGKDIRFTNSTNKPLNFEIARWNDTSAIIWIAIDTILPNDSSQYIKMYWGKEGVLSASNPMAVFDTSRGYAAVWHLEEYNNTTGTREFYKDATPNSAHGDDSVYSDSISGYVGNGCVVLDKDKILIEKNIADLSKDFTICAWVNIFSSGAVVFSQTQNGYFGGANNDKAFYFGDSLATGSSGFRPTFSCVGCGDIVAQRDMGINQWHYYTLKWNKSSSNFLFFIDGGICGTTGNYSPSFQPNLSKIIIGSDGLRSSNLIIDELHISKTARSDEWIMLSFENQRIPQKLLKLEIEK